MRKIIGTNRRTFMKSVAATTAALAMPAVWSPARSQDKTITVGDSGGNNTAACIEAFYKPYKEKTGIEVIPIERRDNPAAEIRAIVETGSYKWDFCEGIGQDVASSLADGNFLETLDLSGESENIPASMKTDTFIGSNVLAFILAYRTDKYKQPISMADFWNVEKFPGRRGLRSFARDTIQMALVADGVAPADVSKVLADEAGWQRAFAKLDAIKPHIAVWWTSAAQTPTLLQTGEVDMCPTFNQRAQAVIDAGTPLAITWDGCFYNNFGFIIPRGSPKADIARDFIKFAATPENQAMASEKLGSGPSNPKAIELIAPERAKVMPTYPDNFKGMAQIDFKFWGPIQEQTAKRFSDWLLK